ncbi:MAG: hypothetical protein LBS62_14690 [Clostridiales bacterium]|nr:hypothetical protein [Clostridiales bacterium]
MLNNERVLIGNGLYINSFKKYLPMRYTNGEFIEDRLDVLDNGIFYAKDLDQDDLMAFDSNEASWFTVRSAPARKRRFRSCSTPTPIGTTMSMVRKYIRKSKICARTSLSPREPTIFGWSIKICSTRCQM